MRSVARILIAPPGRTAGLLFDLITALATKLDGQTVRRLDRTDEVQDWAAHHALYLTNYPSLGVVDAIASGGLAPVLVIDEPSRSVMDLMASEGRTMLEAIRQHSASMVANLAVAGATSRSLVDGTGRRRLNTVVHELVRALGLDIEPGTIANALARAEPGFAQETFIEEAITRRSASGRGVRGSADVEANATRILEPMVRWAYGHLDCPVVWPIGVFLSGDHPNQPAPQIASLVGPARAIIYGPYLHLPPARYRAEIILAFSKHADDVAFTIEMHGASCRGRAIIQPRPAGAYRGVFTFHHVDPKDALEIRLRSETGAIEGEIALVEMRLHPT